MNVTTLALFLVSILTLLWHYLRGTGVSLGGFMTLLSAPMIALGDSTDAAHRTGMP